MSPFIPSKIKIALESTGWQITYSTYIPTDHLNQVRYFRTLSSIERLMENCIHRFRTVRQYVDQWDHRDYYLWFPSSILNSWLTAFQKTNSDENQTKCANRMTILNYRLRFESFSFIPDRFGINWPKSTSKKGIKKIMRHSFQLNFNLENWNVATPKLTQTRNSLELNGMNEIKDDWHEWLT